MNLIKSGFPVGISNFEIFIFEILNNSVFKNIRIKTFSMNLIWDLLMKKKELLGVESKQEFLHVSNLKIYNKLIEKRF